MPHPPIEFVKTAVLCIGVLAGCTAELFHTPSEIRGVWDLQNHGRILNISERSIAVYDASDATCTLDYRQDFAGPRLAEWEVFLAPDGQTLRFREPGSGQLLRAVRRDALPERCVAGNTVRPANGELFE